MSLLLVCKNLFMTKMLTVFSCIVNEMPRFGYRFPVVFYFLVVQKLCVEISSCYIYIDLIGVTLVNKMI